MVICGLRQAADNFDFQKRRNLRFKPEKRQLQKLNAPVDSKPGPSFNAVTVQFWGKASGPQHAAVSTTREKGCEARKHRR